MPNSVGDRIRRARELKDMSQEDLGLACGTTKQTIYKYESGIITNIPLDKIESIADALGVSAAYLVGWDNTTPAAPHTNPLHIAGRDDPFYRYRTAYAKAPPAIKNAVHVTLDALLEPYEPAAIAARAKKDAAVDKSGVDLNAASDEEFITSENDIP